jgi:hypothetical protein
MACAPAAPDKLQFALPWFWYWLSQATPNGPGDCLYVLDSDPILPTTIMFAEPLKAPFTITEALATPVFP